MWHIFCVGGQTFRGSDSDRTGVGPRGWRVRRTRRRHRVGAHHRRLRIPLERPKSCRQRTGEWTFDDHSPGGVPSLSPGHTDPHPIVPWWSIWRRLCLNLSDFNHLTFSKLFDFTAFVSKMHSVCWYWHRCKNKPPLWYLEERSLWNSGDKSVRLKFIV